ncbi:MAG: inositol monophosphatase [Nitrospirales bacterium]|nr:inositol monophosphatase [Nitrospirales bacterium]
MSNPFTPDHTMLQQYRNVASQAARVGAKILQRYAQSGFHVHHKNSIHNLVTDADRESEQAIVQVIQQAFPTHQILAEEAGLYAAHDSPYKWVIDPLDGTTNFAHGFPFYNVSIGLEWQKTCIVGVVIDPFRNELFSAEVGCGAKLNGTPIHVSHVEKLNTALVVTGFSYDFRETRDNLDEFCRFALKTQGLRRTGAAALDLCYVACGRFDGFWELKLNPWDTAAGMVIVQEAGGRITNYDGSPFSIYDKEVVASNGTIHQEMLETLKES